jgi:inner membrane protein
MPSVFSHAVASLGISSCFYRTNVPSRVWIAGAACSVIPDFDVIGFHFGVHYADFWGHRGFTHSLFFAALLAVAGVIAGFRNGVPGLSRFALWFYFFFAAASHGLLDAMTDGGLGVALFSPFDNRRYFFPWRAHPRLPHRHHSLFHTARPFRPPIRTPLHLAPHRRVRCFRSLAAPEKRRLP